METRNHIPAITPITIPIVVLVSVEAGVPASMNHNYTLYMPIDKSDDHLGDS